MSQIKAPFTPEQVRLLNIFQHSGTFHPLTCGSGYRTNTDIHPDGEGVLVATVDGWICPNCDYRQDWAHDFMAKPLPSTPGAGNVANKEALLMFKDWLNREDYGDPQQLQRCWEKAVESVAEGYERLKADNARLTASEAARVKAEGELAAANLALAWVIEQIFENKREILSGTQEGWIGRAKEEAQRTIYGFNCRTTRLESSLASAQAALTAAKSERVPCGSVWGEGDFYRLIGRLKTILGGHYSSTADDEDGYTHTYRFKLPGGTIEFCEDRDALVYVEATPTVPVVALVEGEAKK